MRSARYHNVYEDNAVCFWTSAVVDRIPVFSSPTAASRLIVILDECRLRCEAKILGYVIMPDHIHIVFWCGEGRSVRHFLRQFLGIASAEIAGLAERAANRGNVTAAQWLARFKSRAGEGQTIRVWKERGRAFPVTETQTLLQKLDYMHNNPVRAGLAAAPEDWEYSSASWYLRGTGTLRIDPFDF